MPLLLVALFIAVPIAELAVIIQVGQAIGVWWTIVILIADSILGSVLMRSQGRLAWRRFNTTLQSGRVPAREVADGVLVIFGGALLLTPGFLSDIVGLLFLLPPTRAAFRRMVRRAIERGTLWGRVGGAAVRERERRRAAGANGAPGYDVEGTATEVETESRRLDP